LFIQPIEILSINLPHTADEWLDFIITASIEAADGLVEPRMMRIWKLIRAGIIIYLNALTDETRRMAIIYFQEAGKLLEEVPFFPKRKKKLATKKKKRPKSSKSISYQPLRSISSLWKQINKLMSLDLLKNRWVGGWKGCAKVVLSQPFAGLLFFFF